MAIWRDPSFNPRSPEPPPVEAEVLEYGGSGAGPHGAGAGARGYPPRRNAGLFSLARFIGMVAVMTIVAVIFIFVIPRLETVYADFGTKLPWITQVVLDVSRFVRTPLGWLAALIVIGGTAAISAMIPIAGRWLRLLVMLFLALIIIGLALAVLMPMLDLMQNISGGPSKR